MFWVLAFVLAANVTGDPPTMELFGATLLAMAAGILLTTILGLAAALAAAWRGQRVWVHPKLRQLIGDDLSQAETIPPALNLNYANFVVATSIAAPLLVSYGALVVNSPGAWFTYSVLLGASLSALAGYWWLASRVVATRPVECWEGESKAGFPEQGEEVGSQEI